MAIDRRTLLKSSGALFGASVLNKISLPEAFTTQTTSDHSRFYEKGLVGIQLAHEQFTVPQLIEQGIAAEQAGFDLITASDHFQPWQANEAHSGHAWVTLAALGQRTKRI